MEFLEPLYLDEKCQKKPAKLVAKIQAHQKTGQLQLIVLGAGNSRQLEIFPAAQLADPHFYHRPNLVVVGLAADHERALELVQLIVDDVYHQQENVDIISYFQCRQKGDR